MVIEIYQKYFGLLYIKIYGGQRRDKCLCFKCAVLYFRCPSKMTYLFRIYIFLYIFSKNRNSTYNIFITDNMASDGLVRQVPSGGPPANQAKDGMVTTCSKTKGSNVTFHVDLQEKSIVTGLFIILGGRSL